MTDPTTIYRYRDGLYAVDLVAAAIIHLDFFTWLDQNPSPIDGITAHFGIHTRPADVMLTLFTANGFIENRDGTFHTTAQARDHLTSTAPTFVGPYFASMAERPVVRDMLHVLKNDTPASWASYDLEDDWHKAMEKPEFAEMFTAAMDCRGTVLGQALGGAIDLSPHHHLLDIGGGSGIYACCLADAFPDLTATVFEKPPVDAIATRKIAERGLSARIAVTPGDFFHDPYPTAPDVHLLSNILHDWDVADVRTILEKSAATLPSGGLLVIHDAFLNADKSGPVPVAEYSALLMNVTRGRCYSTTEYSSFLTPLGFTDITYTDTVADRGVMTARQP